MTDVCIFVPCSDHAIWGAGQLDPGSLPSCLRERRLLWIVNGGESHSSCAPDRLHLPQRVLARFSARALHEDVVWQPPFGRPMKLLPSNWPTGKTAKDCSTAAEISRAETGWLRRHGVRYFESTRLATTHAPLMFDALHFTSYWQPCNSTFPEMALALWLLAARVALKPPAEVGHDASACQT